MNEPPRLSAKEMAEYGATPSFLKATRVELILFLDRVNGREYAVEVKNYMNEILEKRRGKK